VGGETLGLFVDYQIIDAELIRAKEVLIEVCDVNGLVDN
jgi:hypothetical protein